MKNPGALLSTEQAAEYLGVSARRIFYLLEMGKLPALSVGIGYNPRGIRIPEAALKAFKKGRLSELETLRASTQEKRSE